MKSINLTLGNGHEIQVLGAVGDIEDICVYWGDEFDTPMSDLLDEYNQESDAFRKRELKDKIREQSHYFAMQYGSLQDGDFQQFINPYDLGEQVFKCLMQSDYEFKEAV